MFHPLAMLVIAAFLGAVTLGFPLALWLYHNLTVLTGWVTVGTSVLMPLAGAVVAAYIERARRVGSDPLYNLELIAGGLVSLVAWGTSIAGSAIPGYFAPAGVLSIIDPLLFLGGGAVWLIRHHTNQRHRLQYPAHG